MIEEILTIGFGAALLRSYLPGVFTHLTAGMAPTPLPAKDPTDLTLTPSSTQWQTEKYCPKCKSTASHGEQMAAICNSCGTIHGNILAFKNRTLRQIWNGNEWVYQYNYDNDPANMEITKEKVTTNKPVVPQPEPVKRTRIRTSSTTGAR